MTDPAGKLRIRLGPGGVSIASTRPVRAAGLFVGRGLTETSRLLPAMFGICAAAQAAACAGACEQALGVSAPAAVRARRARLVSAETLREHLWRILLDWPRFLDEAADAPAMARVMASYDAWRSALTAGVDIFTPGAAALPAAPSAPDDGGARRDLAELCTRAVFGTPPGVWLGQVSSLTTLSVWAEQTDTVAARLLGRVLRGGHGGLGRSRVAPLPALRAHDLDHHLAGSGAAANAFVARPTWEGLPRETSPLTRQRAAPLVHDLTVHFGSGLLTRLAAQLTEVARILAADTGPSPKPAPGPDPLPPGVGLCQVPAARGLLVHRVRIAGEQVAEYRILAPTEWNFHPEGVVACGLTGVWEGSEPADPRPLARLFIAAVDPCVEFDLQVPRTHRPPLPQGSMPKPVTETEPVWLPQPHD
jgi:uptake hydrogenase large subunit